MFGALGENPLVYWVPKAYSRRYRISKLSYDCAFSNSLKSSQAVHDKTKIREKVQFTYEYMDTLRRFSTPYCVAWGFFGQLFL